MTAGPDSALTPGQLLAAKHREAMTPGQHGIAWEAASDVLEALAQIKVGRSGIEVHCMPRGGTADAPGWYDRRRELIGLEGELLPCEPDQLDMHNPVHFAAMANLYGVFLHECGHASHTLWTPASLPDRMRDVASEIIILEEPRMEAQVAKSRPKDARWLRASSLQLDLDEGARAQITAGPLRTALLKCVLVEGRVEAGVLRVEDALPVTQALSEVLDGACHDELRSILAQVVLVSDDDMDALEDLARDLAQLLPPERPNAGLLVAQLEAAASSAMSQAASAAAKELAEHGDGQLDILADAFEQEADEQRSKASGAHPSGATPDPGGDEGAGAPPGSGQDSAPQDAPFAPLAGAAALGPLRMHLRAPTRDEELQRARLAMELRRARWRSRRKVKSQSQMPPGRLRARAAMQGAAQRQMQAVVSAAPWRRTRHLTSSQPYPRVAILADVSTSMQPAAQLISSAVWIISHAVHDCDGSSVAVAFGDRLSLLAPAGRPSMRVMDFETYGGTAFADLALQMAYDQLDLGNPSPGPRLVVVISDGGWSGGDMVELKLRWLLDQGVQVLLVSDRLPPQRVPASARVQASDGRQLAQLLASAMVKALSEPSS